jgi:hypothetical protein
MQALAAITVRLFRGEEKKVYPSISWIDREEGERPLLPLLVKKTRLHNY